MLEASLVGLMLSVAPYAFHYFDIVETITWSTGSAILAVYIVSMLLRVIQKQKKLGANEDPDYVPGARLLLLILSVPVVAIQLLNVIGVVEL